MRAHDVTAIDRNCMHDFLSVLRRCNMRVTFCEDDKEDSAEVL